MDKGNKSQFNISRGTIQCFSWGTIMMRLFRFFLSLPKMTGSISEHSHMSCSKNIIFFYWPAQFHAMQNLMKWV